MQLKIRYANNLPKMMGSDTYQFSWDVPVHYECIKHTDKLSHNIYAAMFCWSEFTNDSFLENSDHLKNFPKQIHEIIR